MRIYMKYAKMLFKSQLVYKKSFILLCIGQFFVPFFVFIGVYLLFQRFDTLGHWAFAEVALLYSCAHVSFALSECFVRGFDAFPSLVRSGDFDRVLLRPLPTALQILGSKIEFTRIGRLLQGCLVLVWAISNIAIEWTLLKGICVLGMLIGGTFIFSGLFIIFASFAFWTIQGMEIANIFTDGGREMTQYPLSIYAKPIQNFFTFIVPFSLVNIYPLYYLLDYPGYVAPFYALVPFLGIFFMIPALGIWRFGVSHYQSTGS